MNINIGIIIHLLIRSAFELHNNNLIFQKEKNMYHNHIYLEREREKGDEVDRYLERKRKR